MMVFMLSRYLQEIINKHFINLTKCFKNYFPAKEDLWTGNYSFTVTFINEKL